VRALVEEAGGSAAVLPADLTNAESVEKLCRDIGEQFGGVDILVNNAGRSIRRSVRVSEDRFHDFSRTMDVNYFGALRLILALLPGMRERGGGHIINVSSIGVQVGPPRFSAYIASKAALDGFTRCAAPELMGYGIDVTTIYMPLVKTDMIAPTKLYDSFSAITPAQAADMICSAIVRRPRRVSTVFGLMGQLGASLAPSVSDVWLHLAYRLFPDSAAARGDVPYDEERPGSLGAVFAKLLPGVHW
jgi:NAD(P)-dependent dehydrogenase (short-subunit alcohol dehydrogenase family)